MHFLNQNVPDILCRLRSFRPLLLDLGSTSARTSRNNSARDDAVYDPFVGSEITIIAADASGCCCYAMEIDPGHCAVSIERWQKWTGDQAILESSGQSYADVMRERADATAHDRAAAAGTDL